MKTTLGHLSLSHVGMILELLAPIVLLHEIPPLDHGAHGAVNHQDALPHQTFQLEAQL